MRIMIVIVAVMVASVLSIAMMPSSGAQADSNSKLQASVNEPVAQ